MAKQTEPALQVELQLTTGPELAAGGDAVAKAPDGRIVFVEGAAPSETVLARVIADRPAFLRASTVRILEPSSDRVEPTCPVFDSCGGCTLQHVAYAAQLKSKEVALVETLRRIGGADVSAIQVEPIWSGEPYGYRTRARFAVGPKGEVGYRGKKSHRVVDAPECPILAPPLADALSALRAARPSSKRVEDVSVVTDGQTALVHLPRALRTAAKRWAAPLHVRLAKDEDTLDANDGLGALSLSPRAFAQANAAGNAELVRWVMARARGSNEAIDEGSTPPRELGGLAVELYSGSGNFTRQLALHFKRVVAVESDAEAARMATSVLPKNVEVRVAPAEEGLEGVESPSLVFLDPPRAGVPEPVLAAVTGLAPARIVYVSCNPGTFARDAARLFALGYRLERVRAFDLYPQTGHLEVASVFTPVFPS